MRKSQKSQVFILIIFLLIPGISVYTQTSPEQETVRKNNEYRLNKDFFCSFLRDSGQVLSSPKHWGKKDFIKCGLILGTSYLLFKNDEKINQWVQSERNDFTDGVSQVVRNLGDGYFLSGLIGGIYLGGEIFGKREWKKTALLSLESFLISGAIVSGIKIITGRSRPYTGEQATQFHPFSFKSRYYSFPSGHSASAFAVATVIAKQSESQLIDFLSYGLASLVVLSRVNDNYHWASDVLIGSAIGYFVG
ncbi:MAG: phosphatase PAP2 family protein, partial [Candidatus Aminicenantia bacterium]